MSEWTIVQQVPNLPLQQNSHDCGVFACKYAEYITRRAAISFTQVSCCRCSKLKSFPLTYYSVLAFHRSTFPSFEDV